MKTFNTSVALTICLASIGCSSKITQNSARECRAADCPAVAVAPAAPILFNYDHSTDLAAPPVVRAKSRRRLTPRSPDDSYILVASTQNITVTTPQNEITEDADDTKVSAVSKMFVDEEPCADAKHGHPAFLRSDLAYSVTGFDCQGDSPSE